MTFFGIQLYYRLGITFLGLPLKCLLCMTILCFRLKWLPNKLTWIDSRRKQYLGDLNLFNSWLKRLYRNWLRISSWSSGFPSIDSDWLMTQNASRFFYSNNPWLRWKTFDSVSTHDSTLSHTHVCPSGRLLAIKTGQLPPHLDVKWFQHGNLVNGIRTWIFSFDTLISIDSGKICSYRTTHHTRIF